MKLNRPDISQLNWFSFFKCLIVITCYINWINILFGYVSWTNTSSDSANVYATSERKSAPSIKKINFQSRTLNWTLTTVAVTTKWIFLWRIKFFWTGVTNDLFFCLLKEIYFHREIRDKRAVWIYFQEIIILSETKEHHFFLLRKPTVFLTKKNEHSYKVF